MNRRVWNGRYVVHEKNDDYVIVECIYTCPYCGEETGAYLTIYPDAYHLIDNGGFYEPLTCSLCGKAADVMFA